MTCIYIYIYCVLIHTHKQIWIYRLYSYSLKYKYIYIYANTYTVYHIIYIYMYLTYLAAIPCQNGPLGDSGSIFIRWDPSLHANGLGGRSQATAWWKARCYWEGYLRCFPDWKMMFFVWIWCYPVTNKPYGRCCFENDVACFFFLWILLFWWHLSGPTTQGPSLLIIEIGPVQTYRVLHTSFIV